MKKIEFDIQRFADISNSTSDAVVVSTADADSISNTADNVTINALDGNDAIDNSGDRVSINGGDGNDDIHSSDFASPVTIDGGTGNDNIGIHGYQSYVNGGDGEDIIVNYCAANVTINGGAGDDYICNYDNYAQDTFYKNGFVISSYTDVNGMAAPYYGNNILMIGDDGNDTVIAGGGALNINGQVGTFIVNGQHYGADYQTKTWYAK